MRFERVDIPSDLDPEQTLCSYFKSHNDNYRIQRSLTSKLWLAFFRNSRDSTNFSLVGPPTKTRQGAIGLCEEHAANLPW